MHIILDNALPLWHDNNNLDITHERRIVLKRFESMKEMWMRMSDGMCMCRCASAPFGPGSGKR